MARKNRRPTPVLSTPISRAEFTPDYSMVRKDLKRIGALAGFFILVLVGLSFVLK